MISEWEKFSMLYPYAAFGGGGGVKHSVLNICILYSHYALGKVHYALATLYSHYATLCSHYASLLSLRYAVLSLRYALLSLIQIFLRKRSRKAAFDYDNLTI